MKIKILGMGMLCLMVINSFAQSGITAPGLNKSIIAPSPEAASMVKYGLIPTTLYSGMANVSVPLCELKSGGLSVPVTISYNYNGYRPGEEASSVGLGWTLSGGGVITRMIKGKLDEDPILNYHWDDFANIPQLENDMTYMADLGEGVMLRQHGMNGMTQFMCEGGNFTAVALIVDQHIWRLFRQEAPTERAAAFALADLAVNAVLVKDALGKFRHLGGETLEGIQDHVDGGIPIVGLFRSRQWRINIVTADLLHAEVLGFHLEVTLEDAHVFASHAQQSFHGFIRYIIAQVAGRD